MLINENAKTAEVMETIAKKLGIKDSDEFGLQGKQGNTFRYPLLLCIINIYMQGG
jgi:hypothetical protein